jgi:eukaryotic-like serine/threonine-protein kinase
VAKVMTEEPRRLTLHRKRIPPHVEGAVLTALAKLPADRFENAAAFARALADPAFTSSSLSLPPPHPSGGKRRAGAGLLIRVTLAGLGLGASAGWFTHPRTAPVGPAFRFYVTGDTARAITNDFAISPDGSGTAHRPDGRRRVARCKLRRTPRPLTPDSLP